MTVHSEDLQQIGASHPVIRQAVQLINNTASNRAQLFVAEGLWATNEVLNAEVPVKTFFWCPEAAYSDEARKRAGQMIDRAERSFRISEKTLARITERDRPDGLVSITQMPYWDPAKIEFSDNALIVVADAMEIPGNLGTLIRTMDAAKAEALILTNRRTRMTHPKVFKGSHGMNLSIPFVDFDDVNDAIDWLKRNDFTVLLADTDNAVHYRHADYTGRTAIVLGNERYGICRPYYEHHFGSVFIPMLGAADSLNVSVSASVLLFEARAQKNRW